MAGDSLHGSTADYILGTRNGNWTCSTYSLTVYVIFFAPQGMTAYPVMGIVSMMLLIPIIINYYIVHYYYVVH